jgi:hypothetical protein
MATAIACIGDCAGLNGLKRGLGFEGTAEDGIPGNGRNDCTLDQIDDPVCARATYIKGAALAGSRALTACDVGDHFVFIILNLDNTFIDIDACLTIAIGDGKLRAFDHGGQHRCLHGEMSNIAPLGINGHCARGLYDAGHFLTGRITNGNFRIGGQRDALLPTNQFDLSVLKRADLAAIWDDFAAAERHPRTAFELQNAPPQTISNPVLRQNRCT